MERQIAFRCRTKLTKFFKNLKNELRIDDNVLAQELQITTNEFTEWLNTNSLIENLTISQYHRLIKLKGYTKIYNENYIYSIFKNSGMNLTQSFRFFIESIIAAKKISKSELAKRISVSVEFLQKCLSDLVHPDLVKIEFLISLLIVKGWSATDIDDYFCSFFEKTVFCDYETNRFRKFVKELRESHGWNQAQMGELIGVSGNTIGKWERGEISVGLIQLDNFKILAQLKGWTLDQLDNYIYEIKEDKRNVFRRINAEIGKLNLVERLQLAAILSKSTENALIYQAMGDFSALLVDYMKKNSLTIEDASKRLQISPPKRLQRLIDRKELPYKIDLVRLAAYKEFVKENGEKWRFEELHDLIFSRFNGLENYQQ